MEGNDINGPTFHMEQNFPDDRRVAPCAERSAEIVPLTAPYFVNIRRYPVAAVLRAHLGGNPSGGILVIADVLFFDHDRASAMFAGNGSC